jgi:hypothetical protein
MTEEEFDWELGYWRVDEAIECLPIGLTTQRDLMEAMPEAYDALPFRETPPEPDADPDRKLKAVWHKLDATSKKDITEALLTYNRKLDEIREDGGETPHPPA